MRLVWVLLASLLCAAAVAGAGLVLKREERAEQPWRARAEKARAAFAKDEATTRKLLTFMCERDVNTDRLLLELSAGSGAASAQTLAPQLARLLGGDITIIRLSGGERAVVATTTDSPIREPSVALWLSPARRQRVVMALPRTDPVLVDSCIARRGAIQVQVVRSLRASAILAPEHLVADDFEWGRREPDASRLVMQARPFMDDTGGPPFTVHAIVRDETDDRWFATLAILSTLGFCFGGALAAFLTRKAPVDDAVLTAIENAAERVAQGDLSSQIGLTVSGRADLTLRKFDRMTAELRETRGKLAEAERAAAWQDIARRIAHEIKNPLSPIKMAIETLRKAHEKKLAAFDEIFDESTHAIREEVERIEHIVREFSDFARLPKARPGAFNLAGLLHETASLYTQDDVVLTLPKLDECLVHADREQLAQVLINLLTNAYDAVRTCARKEVAIGLDHADDKVRMWVDDSGPGVPDKDRERIFEPYVTGKTHGTGLGLSIVKRIVQDHGGTISVEKSTLGGARFLVTLPSAQSLASMP